MKPNTPNSLCTVSNIYCEFPAAGLLSTCEVRKKLDVLPIPHVPNTTTPIKVSTTAVAYFVQRYNSKTCDRHRVKLDFQLEPTTSATNTVGACGRMEVEFDDRSLMNSIPQRLIIGFYEKVGCLFPERNVPFVSYSTISNAYALPAFRYVHQHRDLHEHRERREHRDHQHQHCMLGCREAGR